MSQVNQNALSSAVKLLKSVSIFGIDQTKAAGMVLTACLVSIPMTFQTAPGMTYVPVPLSIPLYLPCHNLIRALNWLMYTACLCG